jgi:hypothetical protein
MTTEPERLETACQANTFENGSEPVPRSIDLARRLMEHRRRYGTKATIGKLFAFIGTRLTGETKPTLTAATPFSAMGPDDSAGKTRHPEEVLGLQPGEYVEIKSESEILQTLDQDRRLNGLAYIPAMGALAGQRFKVFKRMETMYQEESKKVRRLRNTVLLDGVHCDGLLMRCDRACFFYWREAWLRRVDGPKANLVRIESTTDKKTAE